MQLYLLPIFTIFVLSTETFAFNDFITHPELTKRAIQYSNINIDLQNNLCIENAADEQYTIKTLKKWIEFGAKEEDSPSCRASTHFHNPSEEWTNSGLTDTWWPVAAWCALTSSYAHNATISNLTWATGYTKRPPSIQRDDDMREKNEWDWDSAREYYHIYLTGKNFDGFEAAQDETSRKEYMAKSMQALGQTLHLIQDMAVPAHVRNDFSQGHTDYIPEAENNFPWRGNKFEGFVKMNNGKTWFNNIEKPSFQNPFLTDFWDKNDSASVAEPVMAFNMQGLSEFTQSNFLSEYTVFTSSLPYPRYNNCKITSFPSPVQDYFPILDRLYLSSTNGHPGMQVHHLAVISYMDLMLRKYAGEPGTQLPTTLDDACYSEYASRLIPRAIGYSSSLIDYFFRGKMEINAVPFFYDRNGANPNQLYLLVLKVKNKTMKETMKDGKFTLHYRIDDNGSMIYGDAACATSGCSGNCQGEIDSGVINENDEKVIQFFFPSDAPITVDNFKDIQWTLTFKGTLGEEENAVVGKVFPDSNQKLANWGVIIFNEEWETLSGYPQNNWEHGSCWRTGLVGDHSFHSGSGSLLNTLIRSENYTRDAHMCSTHTDTSIEITANTWLEYLIDSRKMGLVRENGKDMQTQYMELKFSNGYSIIVYDGDIAYWPNNMPSDPKLVFVPMNIWRPTLINFARVFASRGIAISDPLTLNQIWFYQKFEQLSQAPTTAQGIGMYINSIRIVEASPYFNICQ